MGKTGLIIGGAGSLGKGMVSHFTKKGWKILSMDINANTEATKNVLISPE